MVLDEPEMTTNVHEYHSNEDGEGSVMVIGKAHIIGRYVIFEYADALKAAESYVDIEELQRELT